MKKPSPRRPAESKVVLPSPDDQVVSFRWMLSIYRGSCDGDDDYEKNGSRVVLTTSRRPTTFWGTNQKRSFGLFTYLKSYN